MKVIHWTDSRDFQLRPIQIKNGYEGDGLPDKPIGGLWCSPADSEENWGAWCREQGDWGDISQCLEVVLDISEEGMLIIDSNEDLQRLPRITKLGFFKFIDFRKLLSEGYKSIWLTRRGTWATRLAYPLKLYSWDCETVLIMDETIVNYYEVESRKGST